MSKFAGVKIDSLKNELIEISNSDSKIDKAIDSNADNILKILLNSKIRKIDSFLQKAMPQIETELSKNFTKLENKLKNTSSFFDF